MDLVGRCIIAMRSEKDDTDHEWTVLVLDTGQEVHILDETPWVIVEPQVM